MRKKISYADHAWLRMDDPNNLMIITGLMTFSAPVDFGRIREIIESYFLRFTRFRQRLVFPLLPFMRPSWEDDPHFNLDTHLDCITLPAPADKFVLETFISALMSRSLDYAHPLWHIYFVENYEEGSAIIARLHHSLGDGIALMQVLLSMAETSPDSAVTANSVDPGKDGSKASTGPVKTLKSSESLPNTINAQDILEESRRMFADAEYARTRLRQGLDFATDIGKLALRWPDPKTLYKGPLGMRKSAAWSDPISLDEIKQIKNIFQATVNDVLITIMAGALGRYIEERGRTTNNVNIRGIVPVNLRPIELDEELGNKFGLVFLTLPIGIDDPVERLHRVKQNMDSIKASTEPVATFGILNLIGAAPPKLEEFAVDFFDSKGTTVITNVPGPQTQLYLAGVPIDTIMAWVPQSGRIGLGISIISYNGQVWLGVATDDGLVPDPENVIKYFNEEFEMMKSQAEIFHKERRANIEEMFVMLDQARDTLDKLLARRGNNTQIDVDNQLETETEVTEQ